MRLITVVKNPASMARGQAFASLKGGFALARYLAAAGDMTEVTGRSPSRARRGGVTFKIEKAGDARPTGLVSREGRGSTMSRWRPRT